MTSSLLSFTESFRYFFWPFTAARLLEVFLSHPNSFCTNSMSRWLSSFLGFNSSLGLLVISELFLMKLLPTGFCLTVTVTDQVTLLVLSSDRKKKKNLNTMMLRGFRGSCWHPYAWQLCFGTLLGRRRNVPKSEEDNWSLRHDSVFGRGM